MVGGGTQNGNGGKMTQDPTLAALRRVENVIRGEITWAKIANDPPYENGVNSTCRMVLSEVNRIRREIRAARKGKGGK